MAERKSTTVRSLVSDRWPVRRSSSSVRDMSACRSRCAPSTRASTWSVSISTTARSSALNDWSLVHRRHHRRRCRSDRWRPVATGRSSDEPTSIGFDVRHHHGADTASRWRSRPSFIESAVDLIGQHVSPGCTVVLESTTYPGTTEEMVAPRLEELSGLEGRCRLPRRLLARADRPGQRDVGLRPHPQGGRRDSRRSRSSGAGVLRPPGRHARCR